MFRGVKIGAILKEVRDERKMRTEDLAALCKVSRPCMYNWFKADFLLPKNLRTIHKKLKIPMSVLESVNGPRPKKMSIV